MLQEHFGLSLSDVLEETQRDIFRWIHCRHMLKLAIIILDFDGVFFQARISIQLQFVYHQDARLEIRDLVFRVPLQRQVPRTGSWADCEPGQKKAGSSNN